MGWGFARSNAFAAAAADVVVAAEAAEAAAVLACLVSGICFGRMSCMGRLVGWMRWAVR